MRDVIDIEQVALAVLQPLLQHLVATDAEEPGFRLDAVEVLPRINAGACPVFRARGMADAIIPHSAASAGSPIPQALPAGSAARAPTTQTTPSLSLN